MAKARDMLIAGVIYGGVWAAGGVVAGGLIGHAVHEHMIDEAQRHYDFVVRDQANIANFDKQIHDITFRIGEACVTAVTPYAENQPLADVSEDGAVGDILANPALPCGNNPTKVREDVRDFRTATHGFLDGHHALDIDSGGYNSYKNSEADLDTRKGAEFGLAILGTIGLMHGARASSNEYSWFGHVASDFSNRRLLASE